MQGIENTGMISPKNVEMTLKMIEGEILKNYRVQVDVRKVVKEGKRNLILEGYLGIPFTISILVDCGSLGFSLFLKSMVQWRK